MELEIKATTVFQRNWEALNSNVRFINNIGGSRSSKTYSICQVIILYCLQNPKKTVSIVRASFPSLRATVMRDFFQIMEELKLYDEKAHSKSDNIYKFPNGSMVEFFSVDDDQKIRGRKRDIAWCNEANEISYEKFQQINMRTNSKIIVDYNPSAIDSYLYELPVEKTTTIHSTYLDNPFLSKEIVEEIENYKYTDEDYYQIFTLGQRCFSRENVYSQWEISEKPEHLTEHIYAIDFGFTHPTAMVKIWYHPNHNEVFIEELIYEPGLTAKETVDKIKSKNVDISKVIVCETARPEIVKDMKQAGYKTVAAQKDVREGILVVKGFKVLISASSKNIQKENFNYRYKKINGIILEEPVKLWDDAMDAIRYGLFYIKKHGLKTSSNTGQIYSFNF